MFYMIDEIKSEQFNKGDLSLADWNPTYSHDTAFMQVKHFLGKQRLDPLLLIPLL